MSAAIGTSKVARLSAFAKLIAEPQKLNATAHLSDTTSVVGTCNLLSEKQKLADSIAILKGLGEERSSSHLQERAKILDEKLSSLKFNLVVVGEFKRGKSTLINALIGAPVLPVATTPLTSVTTIVRYGKETKIIIHMLDGQTLESDTGALSDYITEKGNPNNERRVDFAEVQFNGEILQEGLQIIDTPGTGSVYLHNTKTTYDFLPEADAIIFVFVADQPATRSELDLLKAASQYSAYQFFVLNKTDYLDDEEKAESIAFVQKTLSTELQCECTIFPLSAKLALTSKNGNLELMDPGFAKFELALHDFAIDKQMSVLMQSIKVKVEALAKETEQLILLERSTMGMPAEKLEESLNVFEAARMKIVQDLKDAEFVVKGEIQNLAKLVEQDLEPIVERHKSDLRLVMEQEYHSHKSLDKDALIEHLRENLQSRIAEIFEVWKISENEKIERYFASLNGRFVEKANRVVGEIQNITLALFQLEIETGFELEHLQNKDKHRYAVDNPFTLSIELLPLMMPAFLSKPVIKARFADAAEHELVRNSGRLRADFQERLEVSARSFLSQFNTRIFSAVDEIDSIIRRTLEIQNSTSSIQATAENRLADQQKLLISLRQILE